MPAIAHQNKILGNTSGGGSTILVTTSESTLYGQTVTLSDGTTTLSGTFSNTGECEFTGVMMTGNLTLVCSGVSQSISVPYFGNYSFVFSLFSATVNVTYPYSEGASCTLSDGTTTLIATGSPMAFNVPNAGTWTASVTLDGVSKTDTATITTDGQIASIIISFGTINVTYDNDFRGLSITCVQGGTTITKTAPSAGNAMTFFPPTTGQWTISGTVGGVPYPTTANVTSLSTPVSVNLETIPDGSTATPTDDIQKWLACAGIKDKAYTTLSQVLADSETFNALLGDSNACAYMARSTTWAIGLVPTMTSNTTPSGVAYLYNERSGDEAYHAFNKAYSSEAMTSYNTAISSYILSYDFGDSTDVRGIHISCRSGNASYYYEFKLYGSSDGSTWVGLSDTYKIQNTANYEAFDIVLDSAVSYRYYGIKLEGTNASSASVQGVCGFGVNVLQFYASDMAFTESQYAMSMIGLYDVCCDALLGNATWASAIVSSAYADYVLTYEHGLVPVMTSATTPSGIVSSSTSNTGYEAYKVFDNDSSTRWLASSTSSNYVQYEFDTPVKVLVCKWVSELTRVTSYQLSASNDGTNFTPLINATTTSSTSGVFIVSPSTEYKYYRFIVSTTVASYNTGLISLQFFGGGKDLTNTEKIHGANNESAYYLDGATQTPIVDPSTLSAGTYTFGSTVAKNPSDLTADYTKTIRITPNTKEIVLRPDNSLYWYGYESANLEDLSSANGWSSGSAFTAPIHNNYDVSFSVGGVYNSCGIGTKYKISTDSIVAIVDSATGSYHTTQGRKSKNLSETLVVNDATLSVGVNTVDSSGATESFHLTTNTTYNSSMAISAFYYE